jgi:hypothetical protein
LANILSIGEWSLFNQKIRLENRMKIKSIFHLALVTALAPFLSGCLCTSAVLQQCNKGTMDKFNPSAVYYRSNNPSFALEGTRNNHYSHDNKASFHAFLIISPNARAFDQLQINKNISLAGIKQLSISPFSQLETKNELPSGYKKVANLPNNRINFEIYAHHPEAYLALLLPVTAAFDMATFPFQGIYMFSRPQFW